MDVPEQPCLPAAFSEFSCLVTRNRPTKCNNKLFRARSTLSDANKCVPMGQNLEGKTIMTTLYETAKLFLAGFVKAKRSILCSRRGRTVPRRPAPCLRSSLPRLLVVGPLSPAFAQSPAQNPPSNPAPPARPRSARVLDRSSQFAGPCETRFLLMARRCSPISSDCTSRSKLKIPRSLTRPGSIN